MSLRDRVKAMAKEHREAPVACVVCGEPVKGKNLVRHFDTTHAPFIDALQEDAASGGVFHCEALSLIHI